MAAYRIAYAALFVSSLAFTQIYAGHLSSVVFITVLTLPLVSLLMVIIQRFALKLTFDCSEVCVERGNQLKMQLVAKNRFVFPCSTLFVTASMPDIEDRREARLIFSLGMLQKKQLNFIYPSNFRGQYEITINKAYIFDILKLFKLRKTFNFKKTVLVVPKIYSAVGSSDLTANTDEETVIQTADYMGGERSFVRKYNDTDDVRKIHWKLSSKQEDYMVWQEVKNRLIDSVIFCDLSQHFEDEVKNAGYIDAVLEVGLSACLYNIKQGRDCILAFYNKEYEQIQYIPVKSMDDFYGVIFMAVSVKSYNGEPSFFEEASLLLGETENSAQTVLITGDASPKIAESAKELSMKGSVSFIVVGSPEKQTEDCIKSLKNVKYFSAEKNDIEGKISQMMSQIY